VPKLTISLLCIFPCNSSSSSSFSLSLCSLLIMPYEVYSNCLNEFLNILHHKKIICIISTTLWNKQRKRLTSSLADRDFSFTSRLRFFSFRDLMSFSKFDFSSSKSFSCLFSSWDLLNINSSLLLSKAWASSNSSWDRCRVFSLSDKDCLSSWISFSLASQLTDQKKAT